MDAAKQRLVIEATMPIVGAAFALHQRLARITKSLSYLALMELAEKNGIALGNFDMESNDLEVQLAKFTQFMERIRDA